MSLYSTGNGMSPTKVDVRIECSFDKEVPLPELKPHPKNPNQHSKEQVALLSKAIQARGWRVPICVSKRSGFMVRGHARHAAALYLGLKTAPVDFQEYQSEEEELADLIADNRLSELSERDSVMLRDILIDFPKDLLESTGYDAKDIEAMFPAELQASEAKLSAQIDALDTKPVPTVKWILLAVPFDAWGRAMPHVTALEAIASISVETNKQS